MVLAARDGGRLESLARGIEELHAVRTLPLTVDLGSADGARQLYEECTRRAIVPEILINNAGFALYGPAVESPIKRNIEMLNVNVVTPFVLTRLFLPAMCQRRRGRVLNVASTAGFQPGPNMANYYATKAYVISLSIALAEEVRTSGVSVSVLCPGPTRTEFHERAGITHTAAASVAFLSARQVAERGLRAMERGKPIIVPGVLNALGSVGVRVLPLSGAAKIIKRLHQ